MLAARLKAVKPACQPKCKISVVDGCADGHTVAGGHGSLHSSTETDPMNKILSALILTAFAFGAQAASHAGGAPMKDKAASAPAAAASGAKHADKKEMKKEMKKDESKK